MRKKSLAVGLTALGVSLATSSEAQRTDDERLLAWVESADPAAMLEADVASRRLRLLEVYGLGSYLPGVTRGDYSRCYAQHAAIDPIEGTSDTRSRDLNEKAWRLAQAYNGLALAHLDSAGLRKCDPGMRWLDPVGRILRARLRDEAAEAWLTLQGDVAFNTPSATSVTQELRAEVCAVLGGPAATREFAVDAVDPAGDRERVRGVRGELAGDAPLKTPGAAPAPPPSRP